MTKTFTAGAGEARYCFSWPAPPSEVALKLRAPGEEAATLFLMYVLIAAEMTGCELEEEKRHG